LDRGRQRQLLCLRVTVRAPRITHIDRITSTAATTAMTIESSSSSLVVPRVTHIDRITSTAMTIESSSSSLVVDPHSSNPSRLFSKPLPLSSHPFSSVMSNPYLTTRYLHPLSSNPCRRIPRINSIHITERDFMLLPRLIPVALIHPQSSL
jgi:hypothetical protein